MIEQIKSILTGAGLIEPGADDEQVHDAVAQLVRTPGELDGLREQLIAVKNEREKLRTEKDRLTSQVAAANEAWQAEQRAGEDSRRGID